MLKSKYIIAPALIVALVVVGATALAANGYKFTFQTAENTAVENSKQAQLDQLAIEASERRLNEAYEEAEENDTVYGVKKDRLKRRIIHRHDPLVAETNLEIARRTKEANLEQLKRDVNLIAMEVVLASKELEAEQQKLTMLEELYEHCQAKLKTQTISETDLLNSLYNMENQRIKVRSVEHKLNKAEYSLNELLEVSFESKVDLEEDLKLVAPLILDFSVEDVLAVAQEKDLDLYQKRQDLTAAELKLELTGLDYKETEDEYKDAVYERDIVVLTLADTEASLEVTIRNKYNELLNYIDQYKVTVQFLDLSAKKMKAAQLQFDLGTISTEELYTQKQSHLDAEYALSCRIYDLNKAWIEFGKYR